MAKLNTDITNKRITKLRTYMFNVLNEFLTDKDYQVNSNFLSNQINNYSLDRIPVVTLVENWIIPTKKYREVYEFRSVNTYGIDIMENLKNIGFFEDFEEKIRSNNDKGVWPDIEGIEDISCLNAGSLNVPDTKTAEFSVQIQIIYVKNVTSSNVSL